MPTLIFFVVIALALVALSGITTLWHTRTIPRTKSSSNGGDPTLPHIPRSSAQAHASMSDKEFELFSAAVVIGLGEGHRFAAHSGGAGDHGVDTVLRNLHSNRVIVQSKRYASDNPVTPTQVRDFWGALGIHNAAYGFMVTTSKFSEQSTHTVQWSQGRIRIIDGQQLDVLLKHRAREIALAYKDVLDATAEDKEEA